MKLTKPKPPRSVRIGIEEYDGRKYVRSVSITVWETTMDKIKAVVVAALQREETK